ncbi:MAG TPA: antibiotic biosynthesis monooxygenase [Dehalococcoidia bacterium]|nr:antibiotic biosynthesis monooxygenase [Dehalococcoidia bacterium]
MYAVIFEVEPKEGCAGEYLDIAAVLRSELDQIDGFISVERFQSVTNPGKYVSLSFWRDEEAIRTWRSHLGHQSAQAKGRSDLFADYRIRVAAVVRDYGLTDRDQAPDVSPKSKVKSPKSKVEGPK